MINPNQSPKLPQLNPLLDEGRAIKAWLEFEIRGNQKRLEDNAASWDEVNRLRGALYTLRKLEQNFFNKPQSNTAAEGN
jgi:hypothetical protein